MLKGQALELLGTLMRYTKTLEQDILRTGVLDALGEQMRETDRKVKRPAIAALGELLFYIGLEQERDADVRDSLAGWHVKPYIILKVIRCLRTSADEIVSHYAVQCMLNVCAKSELTWFINADVLAGAYQLYNKKRNQHLRSACAMLMAKITGHSKAMMTSLTSKMGVDPIARGLQESITKVQLAFINILNYALFYQVPRLTSLIRAHSMLLRALMRLLEKSSGSRNSGSTSIVIAAKVLCSLSMLGDANLGFVVECFRKYKLSSSLERVVARISLLAEAKQEKLQSALLYLQKCLGVFEARCRHWSVALATDIMDTIQAHTSRRNASPAERKAMKTRVAHFPLLLEFVNSPTLREQVVDAQLVEVLSSLLVAAEGTSFPGDDTFRETLLSIVEAVSQSAQLLLELNQHVLSRLLPALVAHLNSKNSNNRFLALKILSDILIQLFRPASESIDGELKQVQALTLQVIDQLLPQYKTILKDQDTITQYGLKLLNTLVEIDPSLVTQMQKYGVTVHLMEYFQAKHLANSLHTVKLVRAVASEAAPPDFAVLRQLCQHSLVPSVIALLKHGYKTGKEWFYTPLLELVRILLFAAAGYTENEDGDLEPVKVSPIAARVLMEAGEGATELVSLLMELVLLGSGQAKSRRPSIIQIGFAPSRPGTKTGQDSSLNPHTSAVVRRLSSEVLRLLVSMYKSCQPTMLLQANLSRLSAGLAYG
mmetsp:Transcript_9933/g.19083  ORF Transcript_9933/g.19083 Transcript_9933/m.19083 type:complete len:713 (-) Transcript_9933:17-2155(-)